MSEFNGFVADGYERAYSVNETAIRKEVDRQYADRLSKASPTERQQIYKEMEDVIAKHVARLAPPDALY